MGRLLAIAATALCLAAPAAADGPLEPPGAEPPLFLASAVPDPLADGTPILTRGARWMPRSGALDSSELDDDGAGWLSPTSFAVEPGPYPFSRRGDPADERGRYNLGVRLRF